MNKAIQFFITFMVPFMLVSFSSDAQCSRNGNGNKPGKPQYYKAAIIAADDDDEYTSESKKEEYIWLDAVDICELESILIGISQFTTASQSGYVKNLDDHFNNNLNSILADDAVSNLIFASGSNQPNSYYQLYKLLIKSQFPIDNEIGKQMKIALNGLSQTQMGSTEVSRRGAVLGVVLGAMGSLNESAGYQKEAMKRGAYMGAFFESWSENMPKISFNNWGGVQAEIFNLPSPYGI